MPSSSSAPPPASSAHVVVDSPIVRQQPLSPRRLLPLAGAAGGMLVVMLAGNAADRMSSFPLLLLLAVLRLRAATSTTSNSSSSQSPNTAFLVRANDVFLSKTFSDAAILKQLSSLEHQVELSKHQGALAQRLAELGPCVVSVARLLLERKVVSRQQAVAVCKVHLEESGSLPKAAAWCAEGILDGLRDAAESYLARSTPPDWGDGRLDVDDSSSTSSLGLVSAETGQRYRPVKFLAKGSAGVVYADADSKLALKRIFPTQRESAENEFRVARRLAGASNCLPIIDRLCDANGTLWLVMPRVHMRNPIIGVDLCEYIIAGYFASHSLQACQVVVQLLRGLYDISFRNIILRDVKPDNILVDFTGAGEICAMWSDFGLAVDLGEGLCTVRALRGPFNDNDLARKDTLGFWLVAAFFYPTRPKTLNL